MNKKSLQIVLPIVAIVFNIFGILSLLYANKLFDSAIFAFYDNMRLIVRYIIIIVCMTIGIMSFSVFAGTFEGKLKNGLTIGSTVYATILTLPLLYVFVGCFFAINGATLPMVNEVAAEFVDIFPAIWLQYIIFFLGSIMAIVFLAVPIIMAYCTVKNIDIIKVLKAKLSKNKN